MSVVLIRARLLCICVLTLACNIPMRDPSR